jgi:hypothetical protein
MTTPYNFLQALPLPELMKELEATGEHLSAASKERQRSEEAFRLRDRYLKLMKDYRAMFQDVVVKLIGERTPEGRKLIREKMGKKFNTLSADLVKCAADIEKHNTTGLTHKVEESRSVVQDQINKVQDLLRTITKSEEVFPSTLDNGA